MQYSPETQTAIAVVADASKLCQNVRAEWNDTYSRLKADGSPAGVADFGSQVLMNAGVRENFPHDKVIAEETSALLRPYLNKDYEGSILEAVTGYVERFRPATPSKVLDWIDIGNSEGGWGRHWSADPIDGTKGYLCDKQYAVSLGLFEDGKVLTGVLGCPNYPHDITKPDGDKGVMFIAERGLGMQAVDLNDPTKLIPYATPPLPRIVQRREIEPHGDAFNRQVALELGLSPEALDMDSQAKYGAVALGAAKVYFRLKSKPEHIWDHVPGILIAQEDGAVVTDAYGRPLDLTAGRGLTRNRGVLVSKGIEHEEVIRTVRRLSLRA